jgi:hypothetical protein
LVSDFERFARDLVTQDAIRAAEMDRAAHEAYEADRAARVAFDTRKAARATPTHPLANSPTWLATKAMADSPVERMMNAIHDSPGAQMMRDIENSPSVRMMREINKSPAVPMMREIQESAIVQLSRSLAESFKPFNGLTRSSVPTFGALADGRVVADLSGIAALQDWTAGLRIRDFGLAASTMSSALDSFSALTDLSRSLLEHANVIEGFGALSAYLRIAPTLEAYASASTLHLFLPDGAELGDLHVIDVLAEDMLDGVTQEFEERLASVDQGFLKPVRGAWQTALSDTEDRVRQSASSLRFVVEGMIKQLAPRDKAEVWAQAAGVSKKPPPAARAARSAGKWAVQLRFILRHVDAFATSENSDSVFGYLVDADLVDMLLLLERLNQAVHEPDAHIAEADLTLVLRRVMAFMTLLLDAYEFETPK